jgi:hypothetical protein
MSDTPPNPTGRSSVLYALGRLEAQNDEQRREIAALPIRIGDLFTPRLAAIEGNLGEHGRRITVVERKVWIGMGILATVTTLVTAWETVLRH